MKTLKLVFGIIALCMGVSSNAQQILSSDMTITKPIYFMKVGGNPVKMDPAKDSCTVRFFKFNDGYITYDLELSGSTIRKMLKDGGEAGEKMNFTWTGNINRTANSSCINAVRIQSDGYPAYLVTTPSQQMDGFLSQRQEGWMALITGQIDFISGISIGMTVNEIRDKLKGMSSAVKLVEAGKVGNLTEYTLLGARMEKDAYKRNLTHLRKDDAYAHFYVDNAGKLVKWYMVKKF